MRGSPLVPFRPSPTRLVAPGIVLAVAAASFAAGLGAAVAMIGPPAPEGTGCDLPATPAAEPEVQWATTVLGFSSQFGSNDWAAHRVLGAPDVWPRSGDLVDAWASRGADDAIEHIEVGFDHPRHLAGLDLYETFNPGAIIHVELIAEDGRRLNVYEARAAPMKVGAHRRELRFACTEARIVGAKVVLDSTAVGGWNELDAIGAWPCVP